MSHCAQTSEMKYQTRVARKWSAWTGLEIAEHLCNTDITTSAGRAFAKGKRDKQKVFVKVGWTDIDTTDENNAMKALPRHPCLVGRYRTCQRFDGGYLGRKLIEMEYVGGGSLESFLLGRGLVSQGGLKATPNGPLPQIPLFMFFWQMVSAIDACHGAEVYHGCVTLKKFILCDKDLPHLKLCDFSAASQSRITHAERTVDAAYRAPEAMLAKINFERYDAAAADVWSVGVCLYIMCVGMAPFPPTQCAQEMEKSVKRILSWLQREEVTAVQAGKPIVGSALNLLQRAFAIDPTERITIEEIKRHEFWRRGCLGLGLAIDGCPPGTEEEIFTEQQMERFKSSLLARELKAGSVASSDTMTRSPCSSASSISGASAPPSSVHGEQEEPRGRSKKTVIINSQLPTSPLLRSAGRSFSPARLTNRPCSVYSGRGGAVGFWGKVIAEPCPPSARA